MTFLLALLLVQNAPMPPGMAPQQRETVQLDPATPATTTTLTYTLTRAPSLTAPVLVYFLSSVNGPARFRFGVFPVFGGSQTVTVPLPTYRPFTPADSVVFVYSVLPVTATAH